jgi:hypothetical protein
MVLPIIGAISIDVAGGDSAFGATGSGVTAGSGGRGGAGMSGRESSLVLRVSAFDSRFLIKSCTIAMLSSGNASISRRNFLRAAVCFGMSIYLLGFRISDRLDVANIKDYFLCAIHNKSQTTFQKIGDLDQIIG